MLTPSVTDSELSSGRDTESSGFGGNSSYEGNAGHKKQGFTDKVIDGAAKVAKDKW